MLLFAEVESARDRPGPTPGETPVSSIEKTIDV
jgi:hypothetical protein